jgi:single-stranded-DNA-specific exonuclease
MEIKNLKKGAERIKEAITKKEKIILYGDVDLDGITSLIILKECLEVLGAKDIIIYFPNIAQDGYGLNKKALDFLGKEAPALLILLDCGISNFEEIEIAEKLGFEVMVIDHHEVLDKLPKASIIIDPKQPGDDYLFKNFATSGLVFKLTEVLLGERMNSSLRNNFLELVALSTLADMMPERDENELMIREGLLSLENTTRPALKAFQELEEMKGYSSKREFVQQIISVLNISEPRDNLNDTYLLLTSNSLQEAKSLIKKLLFKKEEKQNKINEIVDLIKKKINENPKETIIFEGSEDWPVPLLGTIASKICFSFQKPTFIFNKGIFKSRGSLRMPEGMNGVEALKSCSELLESFGGHPPAAGFTIKNENLASFRECLIKFFKEVTTKL